MSRAPTKRANGPGVLMPTKPASQSEVDDWMLGALTVSMAQREFALSEELIRELMNQGVLRYKVRDLKGTRLIPRVDLARYVASLPTEQVQNRLAKKPRRGKA